MQRHAFMQKGIEALHDKIVVITGASSGLGRATAVQFAALGCKVVLAARRSVDLEKTARLCREAGGAALCVVTDVTVEDEMNMLAERAVREWGRIDIWVNNAGVTLFARLTEAPFADHRRVIETNVYGAMLGARAVLPIFRRQGRGTLINVGSILSKVAQPFVAAYVVSKFALRGLSETLRTEVADEPGLHICTIFPYTIDTPHFQSGANLLRPRARPLPPVQSPERVASAIVKLAAHPRRELHVPRVAALGEALHWIFPTLVERLILRALQKWHFDEEKTPASRGNLYKPVEVNRGEIHGERPARIDLLALSIWAAREVVRIEVEDASRWWSKRISSSAGAGPLSPS